MPLWRNAYHRFRVAAVVHGVGQRGLRVRHRPTPRQAAGQGGSALLWRFPGHNHWRPTPIGGARRNRAVPHGEGGGQHQRRPAKRPGRQPRLRRGTVRGVHLAAPDPAERSGPGTLRGSVRRHEDRRPALLAPGREETQEGTAPPVPQGQGIEEQGQGSHQGRPARTRGWPTHGASSTTSAQRGSFAITRRLPLRTWR